MADEFSDAGLDLFGQPVRPPRGRGRPGHEPTADSRQFVNMLFVCGHAPMAVARALGLKKTAFYEHYKTEILERAHAALKMKGRQMLRLNNQAEQGNVAAEKALAGMINAEQMRTASEKFADAPKPAAKPRGVKEVRREAAYDAGVGDDGWGPLLHGESGKPLPN